MTEAIENKEGNKGGNKGGGAPASYIGSIQGKFTNIDGRQLFTNPVYGIS